MGTVRVSFVIIAQVVCAQDDHTKYLRDIHLHKIDLIGSNSTLSTPTLHVDDLE